MLSQHCIFFLHSADGIFTRWVIGPEIKLEGAFDASQISMLKAKDSNTPVLDRKKRKTLFC